MSRISMKPHALAVCAASSLFSLSALADINVGVSVSATGPAASLGIPVKFTVNMMPTTVAGQKVNYIVLDDSTNPTEANKNARKLATEKNVDLFIGSSTVPTSMALTEVAFETKTPLLALAPIEPAAPKGAWVFVAPQHNGLMARALVDNMKESGVKTLGFIGYADGFGESWLKEIRKATEGTGIQITAVERYNRTDTSVTGQVVKLVAANPQAILIVGSGTPAALPATALAERGYKGKQYQTHGAANKDFIRVGGKAVEGTILPVAPSLVAKQLPASHPAKKLAMEYVKTYESRHGEGTTTIFGSYGYDAFKLFEAAAPTALKKAKPGTPEFRQALRDALETQKNVTSVNGVFNMSATDHYGQSTNSRVLVKVEKGDWKLVSTK